MLARALLAVSLCALALPVVARAHPKLVRTEPADRSVLAAAPARVRVVFDEAVRAQGGIRVIRNGDGSVLAGRPRVVGGRVLVIPLRTGLPNGDYTVRWQVLSEDGHTVAGVTTFGVGAGRPPPVAALSVDNGPSAQDVVSRFLFFAGLLTAVGAALFRLAVAPVPARLLAGAFLLVFVGDSGLLHDVSLSTRFGAVMGTSAVIAGIGALFAALAPLYPRLEGLPLVCALVLLPAPSLAGHSLDRGRPSFEVVVDALHVAAASLWLGGLVALALALRVVDDRQNLLRRFSNLALASVCVLAATGVIRALSELHSVSQLWSTGYGRVLIVKTGLLGLLVAIGWVNRYRLVPRLSLVALRRNVAVELTLFAGLVAAVALLTDLRPGRDRVVRAAAVHSSTGPPPLPASRMVVQARESGEYAVALAVRPPGAEVVVLGSDGEGVNGQAVQIDGVRARSCGSGCYGAFVSLGPLATVTVGGNKLEFRLPATRRPAGVLVAKATKAFRALHSVDYVERLASSPKDRVVANFTLEHPNRLEYRIRGGASGIIIGARRWDRSPGGRWEPSAQEPTPQPEPIWSGHVTNAYLLESTPSSYVISFMKPIGPAWFTLRLDRRTLLPRYMRMTAPAHFMTHRYTVFNSPRKIRAPGAGR